MSWDILIFNSKEAVDLEGGRMPDFPPRQIVVDQIRRTFPDVDFTDMAWGVLDSPKASIEFNMGSDENIGNNFMLHVRGNEDPEGEILRMCNDHGWIAYDSSGEQLIETGDDSNQSFDDWKAYRDQIVGAPVSPGGNFGNPI